MNIIESNLKEMVSPFSHKLSSRYLDFTPKKIQIADLIKDGKKDKDIMEVLHISPDTVKTHRKNIRKKLGIHGKNIKRVVFSKIENINKNIEKKIEEDMLKLQETEKILENMSKKMNDIKNEAEAMRERSQAAEVESLCDSLTGCYNRKAYDQKIDETLTNLDRHNCPSSLLICDIDNFKKINDSFGHLIGDLTLKKIAKLFKEQLRRNDFIARYGGEEFAIILPYTQMEEAKRVAEKVRSYIDRSKFTFKDKEVPVTLSMGISTFTKGDDASTVFERADVALYLAKNSGRNLVKTEIDVKNAGETFSYSLIYKKFDDE